MNHMRAVLDKSVPSIQSINVTLWTNSVKHVYLENMSSIIRRLQCYSY